MPPKIKKSHYKKNVIHRIYRIYFSNTIFYKELKNIKQILVNKNFSNDIIDQQIKPYFHNIQKNRNNNNDSNTNRMAQY